MRGLSKFFRSLVATAEALRRPTFALTFILGIATSAPYMLTSLTLGYWLREEGFALQTVGFLSWIGLVYSLSFLWSPIVQRVRLGFLADRFGHWRAWMLLGQLGLVIGLAGLTIVGPKDNLGLFAAFAILAATSAATQDLAVDAWRIEAAGSDGQELGASTYTAGLRIGFFAGDVGMLAAASVFAWQGGYALATLVCALGIWATLATKEPAIAPFDRKPTLRAGIQAGVIEPLQAFFKTHGKAAWIMLAICSVYLIPDQMQAAMIAPLYVDLGLTPDVIARVRGLVLLPSALFGVLLAAFVSRQFGVISGLALGSVLAGTSNFGYAVLAHWPNEVQDRLWAVVSLDGFANGFAGATMVAFASRATSPGYTAIQYALLASLLTLLGQTIRGFSGLKVEALQDIVGHELGGYTVYFMLTPFAAIPGLVLIALLARCKGAPILDRGGVLLPERSPA